MPKPNLGLLRNLNSILRRIAHCSYHEHTSAHHLLLQIVPDLLVKEASFLSGLEYSLSKKLMGLLVFCLWKQSLEYDPGIGDTSSTLLWLKDTRELHSSGVEEVLTYFRKLWKGNC